jgi:Tfp pilus assembly protein PilN
MSANRIRTNRDYLVLEWDDAQITAVTARVTDHGVRVKKSLHMSVPESVRGSDDAAFGAWLKGQLTRAGLEALPAMVILPRHLITLKQLELPVVPAEELPEMVRLQAAARSSLKPEDLCLDYLPDPANPSSVMLATVSQALVARLRRIIETAGSELISAGIRPLATAEIFLRGEAGGSPTTRSWLVVPSAARVELSIVSAGQLLASHSLSVSGDVGRQADAIVAAAARLAATLSQPERGAEARDSWCLIDGSGELQTALSARLAIDVRAVSSLSLVDGQSGTFAGDVTLAGPVGMLLAATSDSRPTLDFLAPRHAQARPRRRRHAIAALALLALLTISGAAYVYVQEIQTLDARIEQLTAIERRINERVTGGDALLAQVAAVEEWLAGSPSWHNEVEALAKLLPPPERTYLTSLQMDGPNAGLPTTVRASGLARDSGDVIQLNQSAIEAKGRYVLEPRGIRPSDRDEEYPAQFDFEAKLSPPGK